MTKSKTEGKESIGVRWQRVQDLLVMQELRVDGI